MLYKSQVISFISFAKFDFTFLIAGTLGLVTIIANPNIVNQNAVYSILMYPISKSIPSSGKIMITFPAPFIITSGIKICSITGTTLTSPTCTAYNSNNSIVVTNFGSNSSSGIQITINNILNPSTDSNSNYFKIITTDASNNTLDYDYAITNWQIIPDTLSDTSLTATNQVAGAIGGVTISFTPINSIPQNGYIIVAIPSYNGDAGAGGTQIRPMITTSNPGCSAISGIDSTLICTFSSSTNQLMITSGFTISLSYSSQVKFTVNNFQNPFSTGSKVFYLELSYFT